MVEFAYGVSRALASRRRSLPRDVLAAWGF
jgi:hypothetical protein